MTQYALVTGGTIQAVGSLPRSALRLDGGGWVMGLAAASQALREACGWYEVADTPRPDDTGTTTHDRSVELVADVPTVVWTERPLTDAEIAERELPTKQAELERAIAVTSAPTEVEQVQALQLAAEGIADGDPWRQPQGAHDAYPVGATVTHGGKTWENILAANVWAPGVTGWSEVTTGTPDWVQPAGAHDAYQIGDRVMHNGSEWESAVADNVWEPGVFGWVVV